MRVVKVTGHLSTLVNKPDLSDSWCNLPIAGILAKATILYFEMENFTVNMSNNLYLTAEDQPVKVIETGMVSRVHDAVILS